jgi:two-component system sensor histidine kinase QseC
LITAFSVAGILLTYFRTERLAFLDDQIRQSATSIVESKLSELKSYNDEEADDMISDELGPDRIGKFFVVRRDGEVLFETDNVALLDIKIPQDRQWVTVQTEDHFIRALNLKLPRFQSRTLQVGVIVDKSFISLTYVNTRTYATILIILVVILIFTWFLSSYLFAPIRRLSQYLDSATKALEINAEIPVPPARLNREGRLFGLSPRDEFRQLVRVLEEMVEKINISRKFMKSWTFQMAHELKTPLTIVNRDFEVISEKYNVEEKSVKEVQANIDKISLTVSSFLDWAELNSQKLPGSLYVVNLEEVLTPILNNLRKIYDDRVEVLPSKSFQVLSNPLHLDQLLTNVLSNSLKYSEGKVFVQFADSEMAIVDQGTGIPAEVLGKMGSPFNKSATGKKGIGLGLAWIKTICELYGWQYEFKINGGTEFRVKFPAVIGT